MTHRRLVAASLRFSAPTAAPSDILASENVIIQEVGRKSRYSCSSIVCPDVAPADPSTTSLSDPGTHPRCRGFTSLLSCG